MLVHPHSIASLPRIVMSIASISSANSALTQPLPFTPPPPPQSTTGLAGKVDEIKPHHEHHGGHEPPPSTNASGVNQLV